MTRRALQIVLALYAALMIAIVIAANLGGTETMFSVVRAVPYGDKLGHFVLIGVLAMLVDLAVGRRDVPRLRIPLGPLVLFGIVLAEELSQLALDTRTCDVFDLAADVAGMIVFVSVGRFFAATFPRCESGARRPARRS